MTLKALRSLAMNDEVTFDYNSSERSMAAPFILDGRVVDGNKEAQYTAPRASPKCIIVQGAADEVPELSLNRHESIGV